MNAGPLATVAGSDGMLSVLRRRAALVLGCVALVSLAALAISLGQPKKYSATAELLFRSANLDSRLFAPPPQDADRQQATSLKLLSLPVVAQRTAEALGGGLTAARVAAEVTIEPQGKSEVAKITAVDGDARRAAAIANTYAREHILVRQSADRADAHAALSDARRQLHRLGASALASPRGAALRLQVEQLSLLTALQNGNAELIQQATVPRTAASPRPLRDALLGALCGVLLGIALAFVFDLLDSRLAEAVELEEMFAVPLLAAIPESRALGAREMPVRGSAEAATFEVIHAALRYFNAARTVRSVAVTSAAAGDGKSTVAWHLAVAAASEGTRVLLIDADLRHPGGGRRWAPGDRGLSRVLAGEDLGQNVAPAGELAARTLDLLPAGPSSPNPARLLESTAMRSLVSRAAERYDLVVIDTPPGVAVADAVPLLKQVDGVMVVARLRQTTRNDLTVLRGQLEYFGVRVLGVLANGAPARSTTRRADAPPRVGAGIAETGQVAVGGRS